jgi:hypothetical protein
VLNAKSKKYAIVVWVATGTLIGLSLLSMFYSFVASQPGASDSFVPADVLWGLIPVEFALLAGLILSRQPRNVIGWLLMLPAVAMAPDAMFWTYFQSLSGAPAQPSLVFWLALWFFGWSWLLLIFPVFFILQLFPTGKALSPHWRWVAAFSLLVCLLFFVLIAFASSAGREELGWVAPNPVGFIADTWLVSVGLAPFGIGLLTLTLLSVASVFVRYRRALAVEREQIKWLLFACGVFAAVYLSQILLNVLGRSAQGWVSAQWWYLSGPLALMTIPAAITVAILRYRLWDIDVIIRKTLVYTVLTALLALVYFGIVVLLQALFGRLAGVEQSTLAVVISTLAIAALFTPLRRRIQDAIDRRFFRKRYDAQQVLAQFALTARDETDLDALTAELARVVQETLQPEGVSVWLRRPGDSQGRGDA